MLSEFTTSNFSGI